MSDGDAKDPSLTRRELLAGAAGALGAAALTGIPSDAGGQGGAPASNTAPAAPPQATDALRLPGGPTSAVGSRSPFVKPTRAPIGEQRGAALTPLQDLTGTITPSDLHFEVHHAGVPLIDPARHTLLVHGLVGRAMSFTLDDIRRFPAVTRTHFIECAGNGELAWRATSFGTPRPDLTPQKVAGFTANSEWTGVPLRVLLNAVGASGDARWLLAEGADACRMARSIPMEKAWDDALVAYAQNGEPIRPEQGYPLRLVLPGWEGNTNVKWLRRIELGTRPWMTRWETATYTDPLKDGTARQFSFEMDARSIITSPSHPMTIVHGWWPVTGLAWTGRGTIRRVEVSTDGGASWHDAVLDGPVLPKAHTRFTHMWKWDGAETIVMSRATDDTGYTQPTREALGAERGVGTLYHWNPIYGWKVKENGRVFFHGAT